MTRSSWLSLVCVAAVFGAVSGSTAGAAESGARQGVTPGATIAAPKQPGEKHPHCWRINGRAVAGKTLTLKLDCTVYGRHAKRKNIATYKRPFALRKINAKPRQGKLGKLNRYTGRVKYTPKKNFTGLDRVGYIVRKRGGAVFYGTLVLRISNNAAKPTCSNLSANDGFLQSTTIQLKCSGPGPYSYQILSQPATGKLGSISKSGAVTFTHTNPERVGADSFTYAATGPGGQSNTATVSLNIQAPVAPSCASTQAASTEVNQSTPFTTQCSGQAVTYQLAEQPLHGVISGLNITTGQATYTPATNWFSPNDPPVPDQFVMRATNAGGSADVTVNVTVLPDPPNCSSSSTTTTMGTADSVPFVCTNQRSELGYEIIAPPQHGTLGAIDTTTGRVTYTPDSGYFSPGTPPVPDTFTYKAMNSNGTTDPITVSVTVLPPPPTCSALSEQAAYETLLNVTLPCSSTVSELTFDFIGPLPSPSQGVINFASDFAESGDLTFTPATGFFTNPGEALTFQYRATNSGGSSATKTLRVQVDQPGANCADLYAESAYETPDTYTLDCSELVGSYTLSVANPPPSSEGIISIPDPTTTDFDFTPAAGYYTPEGDDPVQIEFTMTPTTGPTTTVYAFIEVLPPAPTCTVGATTSTNYMQAVDVDLDCTGPELQYSIVQQPQHGEVEINDPDDGVADYTPTARYDGPDSFTFTATNRAGSAAPTLANVEIKPWRMRAIGDSVTAGFGFYDDGSMMSVSDLFSCKPPDVVNDRCSSNSASGPGYSGSMPQFAPDWGLANNVAWPAQFANGIQGGGAISAGAQGFENLAVTGSAPSDWISGGHLKPIVDDVIAEDPDLVTMTLGANPILSNVLLTARGELCAAAFTVNMFKSCVQPLIDEQNVPGRLSTLLDTIVNNTQNTQLVGIEYHQAIAAVNFFSPWQMSLATRMLNRAVDEGWTRAQNENPSKADRLTLIPAETNPNRTSPTKLPWFNIGIPPTIHDNWNGRYNCGWWYPDVDGPSNQSTVSQVLMASSRTGLLFTDFCFGNPWIISADTGIHPNQTGHAQFAATLSNVAAQKGLVPPLP